MNRYPEVGEKMRGVMVENSIGIYSFPKSGNTWVRHIIGKGLEVENVYKGIPDYYTDPIWENPININGVDYFIFKSHSRNPINIPERSNIKRNIALYIVRHPLDVFCSQLNYVSKNVTGDQKIVLPCESVDSVVEHGNIDLFFGAFCVYGTLQPSFIDAGSWFVNAENWLARSKKTPEDVFVVRYEDLISCGVEALKPFIEAVGLEQSMIETGLAAAKASTKVDGKFFWKQQSGTYKELLSKALVDRFYSLYGERLEPFGYTSD